MISYKAMKSFHRVSELFIDVIQRIKLAFKAIHLFNYSMCFQ